MINGYEIKIENNEEILCLYIDFNSEFANLDFDGKIQKFKDIIIKYIKKNKIKFTGTKVALVIGGIVMATVLINNPVTANEDNIQNMYEKIEIEEIKKEENNDIKIKDDITVNESVKEEIETEEKVENNEESTNSKTENNKVEIEQNKEEQTNNQNKVDKEEFDSNKPKEEITENKEQKTYVTIYRTNGTVLTIELEEYVIGVVGAEMPASFHEQALMSQAIISRTYALKAIKNNKVLTDNSSTQNYKDNNQLKSMWGNSYDYYYNKIKKAVEKTKGVYLTHNSQIIEAVYHSTSNGYTEDSKNVWGNTYSYLVSVESPYDKTNQSFETDKFLTYEQLSVKLNTNITIETDFNITGYTEGNRVSNIEINGNNYTGVKLRNILGLRSADFEITKTEEGITFTTKGYGHGVGLSQYGANGMAKNGYTYDQILKHYYQGITINYLD